MEENKPVNDEFINASSINKGSENEGEPINTGYATADSMAAGSIGADSIDVGAEAINAGCEFKEEPKEAIELDNKNDDTQELITVRPVKFQQFEQTPPNRAIKKNLDIMQDVSMHISVELGRTKSSIREIMELEKGSIVELDKIAGEQVEIYVNEKLVAKGEVIVIEDKFGVRVTTTNLPKQD